MRWPPFVIFALAVLAQWAVPLAGIWRHEQVLARGALIKLKCTAPDPYDPLRGRYLVVLPEQSEVPVDKGMEDHRGAAFAVLEVDADGFAKVIRVERAAPASGLFVKVRIRYAYGGKARFDWPFDRFYLNEKLAPEADKWLAESLRGAKGVTAEVRVLDGRAVLFDLSLGGRSFREHLEERLEGGKTPGQD